MNGLHILAEFHAWPELDSVTLYLYVCNHSQDNRAAAQTAYGALRAEFKPGRRIRRDVLRGDVDPDVRDASDIHGLSERKP